jgi:sigma-54 specific flagellar transcriptional regulator A
VYTIENPPLAERTEDLEELITVLSIRLKKTEKKIKPATFDAEAMGFLRAYSWPGNIRELANFLQKCSVLFSGQTLGIDKIKPLMPNFETGEVSELAQASLWDDVGQTAMNDIPISAGGLIQEKGDFASYFAKNQPLNLNQFLSEIEENLITTALEQANGGVEKAAQNLGLTQKALLEKIKFYAVINRSFQSKPGS